MDPLAGLQVDVKSFDVGRIAQRATAVGRKRGLMDVRKENRLSKSTVSWLLPLSVIR